jgi:hypothetical protein
MFYMCLCGSTIESAKEIVLKLFRFTFLNFDISKKDTFKALF